MTLGELTEKDLTKIMGKYFYLRGENVFNIFVGIKFNCYGYVEFEPISLKVLLTELSSNVSFGNNFTSVAECLNLPYKMINDAKKLDKSMVYAFGT